MPTYQYRCPDCGHTFDKHLNYTDNHNRLPCPQCRARAQRIFSPPTLLFKGPGFYTTDNRPPSHKNTPS